MKLTFLFIGSNAEPILAPVVINKHSANISKEDINYAETKLRNAYSIIRDTTLAAVLEGRVKAFTPVEVFTLSDNGG